MPFILYISSSSLYTGEIYESNRLHLILIISGSLFYLTITKEEPAALTRATLERSSFQRASIKEKIQRDLTDINDVIHAINKDYRLGLPALKKSQKN